MKKRLKEKIVLLMIGCMCIGMFTGCGNSNEVENTVNSENEESTTPSVSEPTPTPTPEPTATPEPTPDPAEVEAARLEALKAERLANAQEKLDLIRECYYATLDDANPNAYFVQRMSYSYTNDVYNQSFEYSKYNTSTKDGIYAATWESCLPLSPLYYDHWVNMNDKEFSITDFTMQYDDEATLEAGVAHYLDILDNFLMEGVPGFAPMFAKHEVTFTDVEETQVTFGTEEKNVTSQYRVGFTVDGTDYGYSLYFAENGDLLGIKYYDLRQFFYSKWEETIDIMRNDGVWEDYEWTIENSAGIPDFQ